MRYGVGMSLNSLLIAVLVIGAAPVARAQPGPSRLPTSLHWTRSGPTDPGWPGWNRFNVSGVIESSFETAGCIVEVLNGAFVLETGLSLRVTAVTEVGTQKFNVDTIWVGRQSGEPVLIHRGTRVQTHQGFGTCVAAIRTRTGLPPLIRAALQHFIERGSGARV